MTRGLLLLVLALAGCAKGPDADLPSIGSARSLSAEWALVNELAGEGKVTDVYARTMQRSVREQLTSLLDSLEDPNAVYARHIRELLSQPDDAPPQSIRAHSDALKQIEDQLESA